MKVSVPDQAMPVPFTLRAMLTTSDIVFDPPSIAFGKIYVGKAIQ